MQGNKIEKQGEKKKRRNQQTNQLLKKTNFVDFV